MLELSYYNNLFNFDMNFSIISNGEIFWNLFKRYLNLIKKIDLFFFELLLLWNMYYCEFFVLYKMRKCLI